MDFGRYLLSEIQLPSVPILALFWIQLSEIQTKMDFKHLFTVWFSTEQIVDSKLFWSWFDGQFKIPHTMHFLMSFRVLRFFYLPWLQNFYNQGKQKKISTKPENPKTYAKKQCLWPVTHYIRAPKSEQFGFRHS